MDRINVSPRELSVKVNSVAALDGLNFLDAPSFAPRHSKDLKDSVKSGHSRSAPCANEASDRKEKFLKMMLSRSAFADRDRCGRVEEQTVGTGWERIEGR
jgi:hypothetical protein